MDGFTPGGLSESCCCCCCKMGGAADCETCAMSDDSKQFLVVASDDFRHSLRIPREVGSHMRNMIPVKSDLVKLEPPNGCIYPVEVSREFGAIVLRSGWNEFVTANHIQEDYSILFVYWGDSRFKVHIFGSSGREKSSCCQPPCGVFGEVPPPAPCDHHDLNEQVVPDPGHVQNSADFVYTMLPGCRLTKAQDQKVLEIVDTIKSEIPLHVVAMNKRNINLKDSYVYVPLQLVLDHFKDKRTEVTIQLEALDKNIYRVGASKNNNDQIVLNSEWDTFVASHHIQEDDLLIFRSTENNRLEVVILDPSGREKSSSCFVMANYSSTPERSGDDSVKIVDPPPHATIDLVTSDDDDIMREGRRDSCRPQKRVTRSCAKAQKMASTSSPSTKSGYGARNLHDRASVKPEVGSEPLSSNLQRPFRRRYIIAKQTTLPLQMERKVEKKVQAIGSEHPIFVKVMTAANIDGIARSAGVMAFGMSYASACLPDEMQPLFLKMAGRNKVWHAKLIIGGRKQRRVYNGWKEFVGDNHLKVGDICLFEVSSRNTTSLTMTVHLVSESEVEP